MSSKRAGSPVRENVKRQASDTAPPMFSRRNAVAVAMQKEQRKPDSYLRRLSNDVFDYYFRDRYVRQLPSATVRQIPVIALTGRAGMPMKMHSGPDLLATSMSTCTFRFILDGFANRDRLSGSLLPHLLEVDHDGAVKNSIGSLYCNPVARLVERWPNQAGIQRVEYATAKVMQRYKALDKFYIASPPDGCFEFKAPPNLVICGAAKAADHRAGRAVLIRDPDRGPDVFTLIASDATRSADDAVIVDIPYTGTVYRDNVAMGFFGDGQCLVICWTTTDSELFVAMVQ